MNFQYNYEEVVKELYPSYEYAEVLHEVRNTPKSFTDKVYSIPTKEQGFSTLQIKVIMYHLQGVNRKEISKTVRILETSVSRILTKYYENLNKSI